MKRLTVLFAVAILLVAGTLPALRTAAQDHVVTDANLNQKLADAKTAGDHEMPHTENQKKRNSIAFPQISGTSLPISSTARRS